MVLSFLINEDNNHQTLFDFLTYFYFTFILITIVILEEKVKNENPILLFFTSVSRIYLS